MLCALLSSDLHPSGSVNRLKGPNQVILATSGDGWLEQTPLGVCPPSTNYPGSNSLLFLHVIIINMHFVSGSMFSIYMILMITFLYYSAIGSCNYFPMMLELVLMFIV